MKKKIGTILEEDILLSAKQMALIQKKSLSEFFEDAIRAYLKSQNKKEFITDNSKGSMPVSQNVLTQIMAEESYFES